MKDHLQGWSFIIYPLVCACTAYTYVILSILFRGLLSNTMNEHTSSTNATKRFSFDAAAAWSLSGTLAVAALAFIPSATIPFLYTKVTLLALGVLLTLAFFILARLTKGNAVVPPMTLVGFAWLVPAAYLLSSLFSGVSLNRAVFGTDMEPDTFGFVVLLAALATLAAVIFRKAQEYRSFFKVGALTLAVVLVVQVLFVAGAKIAPDSVAATTNLVGTFADLAMLAGLGVIAGLLTLRFRSVSKRNRILLIAGMALAFFVLALANMPWVWSLVALVAFGLFIEAVMHRQTPEDATDTVPSAHSDEKGNRSLAAPLVVLALSLFFLVGGSTIGDELVRAMGTSVIDVRPSWGSTFDVGSHVYASSPLFGSGPSTFGEQWLMFRDPALNETIFWNIDFVSGIGFIPTSFVTTGIVGVLAWIGFIGAFIFFGVRTLLFNRSRDGYVRYASLLSFTAAAYVLVLSVFNVPGPVVLATGFVFLGVFISTLRFAKGETTEVSIVFAKNPRVGFAIVFTLTLLLLGVVFGAYVAIERYLAKVAYADASNALTTGTIQEAEDAINRSILFAESDRAYQVAAAIKIARMNQIAADTTLAPSDAQSQFQLALSQGIEASLLATQLEPNNYQNWAMLGSVYQTVVPLRIEGAYENAKTAYERAMALNPSNPTLPYVAAQLEIAQGNNAAAEEYLIKSISLKRDYTQAIFLLSQLQVAAGRAREALEAAEAAAYFAPNDPTVLFQVGLLRSGTGNTDGAIEAFSRAVEVNPEYANARFFLAVAHSLKGQYAEALVQLETVAALSAENAAAVAGDIAILKAGRNPFPPTRLGALGIPQPTVTDGAAR